ncbi:MAG: hypothetical protein ABFE16_00265, partial [Armatimonadia bacterium]
WSNRYLYDGEKVAARRYVADASPESWVLYHNEGPSIYAPLVGSCRSDGGGSMDWHLFDALGSTIGMTDNTGGLIGSRLYEAFGNALHSSGIGGDPYNYVGAYGYYQDTFALHLLWHRWYDAATGRFLSRDPVGLGTRSQKPLRSAVAATRAYWRNLLDRSSDDPRDWLSRSSATELVALDLAPLPLPGLYPYVGGAPVSVADPSGKMPKWLRTFLDWILSWVTYINDGLSPAACAAPKAAAGCVALVGYSKQVEILVNTQDLTEEEVRKIEEIDRAKMKCQAFVNREE